MMVVADAVAIRNVEKTFLLRRAAIKHKSDEKKTVLRDINLEIKKGECFGLIGRNGSGKSTLLKIISKILQPDSGTISVSGEVASILELGMGFHPDLSGRENIYIKSAMYGFSKKETDGIVDSIIEFSELADRIEDPIRTYSSGMTARLAFAVMIHVKCEILIVDEVLSVGDVGFHEKCASVFESLKRSGITIILASNALETIESMCDRVAWIEGGVIREIGPPDSVCYHYTRYMIDSPEAVLSMAESGDITYQNRIAMMYRDGIGLDSDVKKAEYWLRKASGQGSIEAKVNLADLLMADGRKDEAMELYERAAESGNQYAQVRISTNQSDADNIVEALTTMAESGSLRAMIQLYEMFSSGIGVVQNKVVAYGWIERAANTGDASAKYNQAIFLRDGVGVSKNPERAIALMEDAAKMGYVKAKVELSNIYRKGMGVNRDMSKAIYWLQDAASSGDSKSMYQLGVIYRDGTGVEPDEAESQRWFSLFASSSIAGLQYTIGDIILKSYSSESNRKDAKRWFEDSASHGSAQSMHQLGIMYRDGLAVIPNSSSSIEWFQRAADHGSQQSTMELGYMYMRGNGVASDIERSFQFYSKMAMLGNSNARYWLGVMYRDGIGTEQDLGMAKSLFILAAESGNRDASLALSKM